MRVTFVLVADVAEGRVEAFQRYEDLVLPLLARHGGRLERRLRTEDARTEVHVVSFDSEAAYEAFVADPERQAHRGVLSDGDVVQRLLRVSDA